MGYLHEEISERIIGCAIEVHRELGPGLLESTYEAALHHELSLQGLHALRQISLPIYYKGKSLDVDYRLDLLVEDKVIIELKSIEKVLPIHEAQLLTYLLLSGRRLGLLLNFNVPLMKDGILRRIL